jgi:hypothetical protein
MTKLNTGSRITAFRDLRYASGKLRRANSP